MTPDPCALASLGLNPDRITVAMRPPPEGALYHREENLRFEEILKRVRAGGAQVVLLPRTDEQAARYRREGVTIPSRPVDGPTLLATVDLTVGAGGTMTRESALLGTPTYTVFIGELAAVDAELIRLGRIVDLRQGGFPAIEPRKTSVGPPNGARAASILDVVVQTIEATGASRGSGGEAPP